MLLIYLVLKLPRPLFGFLVVLANLNPVEFCWSNSWLALVRGKRGEGLPVPGRTGPPAEVEVACRSNTTLVTQTLALKAHILLWGVCGRTVKHCLAEENKRYSLSMALGFCLKTVPGFVPILGHFLLLIEDD